MGGVAAIEFDLLDDFCIRRAGFHNDEFAFHHGAIEQTIDIER